MNKIKQVLAGVIVVLLVSCDKDFNTIGTDLVGGNHFDVVEQSDFKIQTTNVRLDGAHPVQTNNLPYNVLGVYNDPVYGTTTANILTQVGLSEYGKEFEENATLKKVILSIPYYSRKIATDENGVGEYELDSVYGNTAINLKMYRSNYFLNEFDPNTDFEDRQNYYSDANTDPAINLMSHNTDLLFEKNDFLPTADEFEVDWTDEDGEPQEARYSPRLRDSLNLDLNDFQWVLDPNNQEAMASANNFKDFYRGVYFEATALGADGVLAGLDLSEADIEVVYEYPDLDNPGEFKEGAIKILFSGNSVNTFENTFGYTEAPDKIYLKGGEGAMAILDLFSGPDDDGDGVSNELEDLRNRSLIINEANLEFYVDQTTVEGGESEPERIFLYNLERNGALLDYAFDLTSSANPVDAKIIHLGKLERDDLGNGVKYKIRITEHITDLVKNDSTNVSLGLIVSNNVTLLGSSALKTPVVIGNDDEVVNNDADPDNDENNDVEYVLSSSVNTHEGTVLYNENAVDDTKRLKLKIYYTEEEN